MMLQGCIQFSVDMSRRDTQVCATQVTIGINVQCKLRIVPSSKLSCLLHSSVSETIVVVDE